MLDKRLLLERAIERAEKQTHHNPETGCLEWTGLGSEEKSYRKRVYDEKRGKLSHGNSTEALRISVQGRQIHPRRLFWAVDHGLAIADVPYLRCTCGNPLCVLPDHMEVKGPPAASAAPALAPPGSPADPADLVRALFPTASGTTDLLAELSSPDGGAYFLAFHKFHLMEPIPAGTTAIELMDWYEGEFQFEQVHLDRYLAERKSQ